MLNPKAIAMVLLSSASGLIGSLGQKVTPFQDLVDRSFLDCCGIKVNVASMALNWPLGMTAEGLTLKDKKGKLVLKARRLSVSADPRDLLSSPRLIKEVRLSGVQLYLARDAKGHWNLEKLLQGKTGSPPTAGVKRLILTELTLNISDAVQRPVLKHTEMINSLSLDLSDSSKSLPLVLEKKSGSTRVKAIAVLRPQGWGKSKLTLTIKQLPAAKALVYARLGWIEPLPAWAWPDRGAVSGFLRARGGGLGGKFTLTSLHRRNSKPVNINAAFTVGPKRIDLSMLKASSELGRTVMTLRCQRPPAQKTAQTLPCRSGEVSLTLHRFPIESLTAFLPYTYSQDLRGAISGRFYATGTPSKPGSLKGAGELSLQDGQMTGWLPGEPALALHRLDTRFSLAGGKAHFQRLTMMSDSLDLDMSGVMALDGGLDFKGKVRLTPEQLKKSGVGFIKPVLKDGGGKVEARIRVRGTVAAAKVDPDALDTLQAGISDNFRDAGNVAERTTKNLANKIERSFKKIF